LQETKEAKRQVQRKILLYWLLSMQFHGSFSDYRTDGEGERSAVPCLESPGRSQ